MALLEPLMHAKVSVITNDGRNFVGILSGLDQTCNLVLTDCVEREYSRVEEGKGRDEEVSKETRKGLYVVRGDLVAMVGEIDEAIDDSYCDIEFKIVDSQFCNMFHCDLQCRQPDARESCYLYTQDTRSESLVVSIRQAACEEVGCCFVANPNIKNPLLNPCIPHLAKELLVAILTLGEYVCCCNPDGSDSE